jgi:hypothetical protein
MERLSHKDGESNRDDDEDSDDGVTGRCENEGGMRKRKRNEMKRMSKTTVML